jgi:Na+/H+ antiporter NhaD/arsenite permease-like protein
MIYNRSTLFLTLLFLPFSPLLAAEEEIHISDFTRDWAGIACLIVFALAYFLAVWEESLSLRKSKPVLVGAGVIWTLVAVAYVQHGDTHTAEAVFRLALEQFTELFLFLLAAMTYVNAMSERGVFVALRGWLISRNLTLLRVYWMVGGLTFFISPLADNLTTALIMATVVVTVGGTNKKFVLAACINVVVAANAGGVFSPFGDITTLMVWQQGVVAFQDFFTLFIPALVNWLVPAMILSFIVPVGKPQADERTVALQRGALTIIGLFVASIILAVSLESFLGLPAVIGMMTGLGVLKLYGYSLKRRGISHVSATSSPGEQSSYDIFRSLERAEWDTLMFLYGILMCVAGLSAMGYLILSSELTYGQFGPTTANVGVGILSAVVENVPVMFTVLTMAPEMNLGQWLLVTLTAGVGGSLLSIGSSAGIAVMGQSGGVYTFFTHLRWSWAVALGYFMSIWVHMILNADKFGVQ